MSTPNPVNKKAVKRGLELQWTTLRAGVANHLDPNLPVTVNGQVLKQQDLLAACDAEMVPHVTVRDTRVAYEAATRDRRAKTPASRQHFADIRSAIIGALGAENPDLENFGFKPRKPRQKATVAEKQAAVAKGKATRDAHHPKPATPKTP